MSLELRPNCEYCDRDLPADSQDAMICTYECTFCRECVAQLDNVCPNCGGGFAPRPIRPKRAWRAGLSLTHQPASTHRVFMSKDKSTLGTFIEKIKHISPEKR